MQPLPSSQLAAAEMQPLFLQTELFVHASPSSQAAPLLAVNTHPVVGSQTSLVHPFASSHGLVLVAEHTPDLHAATAVHAFPSLQSAPSGRCLSPQVPDLGSQTALVHAVSLTAEHVTMVLGLSRHLPRLLTQNKVPLHGLPSSNRAQSALDRHSHSSFDPAWHEPDLQASSPVHLSPSSQPLPSVTWSVAH